MKLPEITYGPVQDSTAGRRVVDEATRQATATIASGLEAFGREVVRTESQKAAATVNTGLGELENELKAQPYVPADWVKAQLGEDLSSVPEDVRDRLDRGEAVPTWSVSGAVYQRRSRELVQKASDGMLTGGGWKAEFQAAAGAEASGRQMRFNGAMAQQLHQSLQLEQKAVVAQYVRGRSWGQALATIDQSKAFEPGEKAMLREHVLAKKEEEDGRLAAQKEMEIPFAAALAAAERRRPNGEVDVKSAQAALDATPGLDAKQRLRAQGILDDRIRQARDGYHQTLGDVILAAKTAWQNGDAGRKIAPYTDPNLSVPPQLQTWLRNASHPGGPDAWEQLLGWHQSYVNRDRANAQLPTPAQTATAAELEVDIVRETEAGGTIYRAMPVGQFVQAWAPRLTEQQFDRVFSKFLTAQGGAAGGGSGLLDDTAILLNAMPLEWRPGRLRRPGAPDPNRPTTWTPNTRPWAAWTDLSEAFDTWLRGNPKADVKAKNQKAAELVAERLTEQLRERSFQYGKPNTVYGFEVRRRTDLNSAAYVEDPDYEPPQVPGVPNEDLKGIQDALHKVGRKANRLAVLEMWNSRTGAQPAK